MRSSILEIMSRVIISNWTLLSGTPKPDTMNITTPDKLVGGVKEIICVQIELSVLI